MHRIPLVYEKSTIRLTSVGLAQARPNYIYILLCVVRRAAYPKLIQFNPRNVYKICIV